VLDPIRLSLAVPEYPDIALYLHALAPRIVGQVLERVRVASPFLVRSVTPPLAAVEGRVVRRLDRIGKRIAWHLDDELTVIIHLMIAGRFRWKPHGAAVPGKVGLAAFDFGGLEATGAPSEYGRHLSPPQPGTLLLTEAGSKRRASLIVVHGDEALRAVDPGGIDPIAAGASAFAERLRFENHTLKRALTDPRLFSGIGNAYSDEILHAAQLSPLQLTRNLDDGEIVRLHAATRQTLSGWTERLIAETGDGFPEKVTAFREGMAVHGRYGQPCPRCGSPVQRVSYADNECNYCAPCQTGGRLLADRALSRLLREDWPRTLEALENLKQARRGN
jgi:formamidopyrimidine-DNA glycosylase